MSTFEGCEVTCTACGAGLKGVVAVSVNARRSPAVRQQIVDGTFHTVSCACGAKIRFDSTFLFSDFERRQFVYVAPPNERENFFDHEIEAQRIFSGMPQQGVRVVFGIDRLAEKLRIWDTGLDDITIELCKLELVAETRAHHVTNLTFRQATPTELFFEAPARDGVYLGRMPRLRYHELQIQRSDLEFTYPALFLRPFVAFERLLVEPQSGPL